MKRLFCAKLSLSMVRVKCMQRHAFMKTCMLVMLGILPLSTLAEEVSPDLSVALTKLANHTILKQDKPIRAKRTTVRFSVANRHPAWELKTLHPLQLTRTESVFLQGRLKQKSASMVSNVGSGYRWLIPDNNWVLGVNGFYDEELRSSTERVSVGGEAFSKNTSLHANLYSALGGHPGQAPACDGYDLKFETTAPFLTDTRLRFNAYKWNATSDTKLERGWSTALKASPSDKLGMELGASRNAQNETGIFINLTYHFDKRNKGKATLFNPLAPQHTRIVREFDMHSGSS